MHRSSIKFIIVHSAAVGFGATFALPTSGLLSFEIICSFEAGRRNWLGWLATLSLSDFATSPGAEGFFMASRDVFSRDVFCCDVLSCEALCCDVLSCDVAAAVTPPRVGTAILDRLLD